MHPKTWNGLVSSLPNPHFLQTHEWGQVKAKYGWIPLYAVWITDGRFFLLKETDDWSLDTALCSAASLILKRAIPLGGMAARVSILYAPKGPLLNWADEALRNRVLTDLQMLARREGAIFIKADPDVVLGTGVPGSEGDVPAQEGQVVQAALNSRGWRYSADQIQFRNTVLIDLAHSEAELLGRMKQKTRYNVRLAERKGVSLRIGSQDDFEMLYRMYAETSIRDGFAIRDQEYYRTVWQTFMRNSQSPVSSLQSPTAEPLIAQVNHEPIAAIFVFYFAGRAFYVYGMSRDVHREKMPSYLLQWEAMKRARQWGASVYDLWGAPEVFDETDSMWGVYRFKEGLGGRVVRTLGAWDFAPNPLWYKLYSETIPRLLDIMRSRGRVKTRQSLGGA